eukprot:TRINITY_DN2800_c1_g1_i1.p1 TRINITY_DN2800_c1_g1~~TRINITY_DN2800_c1_g1_i1.p1  ORF type:complete len:325 (-),score=65.01 TRINITY_DN2800_c1_g1_i1:761-1735(-)
MLRKRSRGVSSNQGLMSDHTPISSPTDKYRKPTSSFFSSPRLFTTFSAKGFSDSEAVMSPTSTLDSKPFSGIGSTFWSDKTPKSPKPTVDHRNHWEKIDSRGVGLGIVDALIDDNDKKFSKPDSRMVLFGSQLKIQIPPLPPSASSLGGSPGSPSDFGIKTRNSLSGPFSPAVSPCPGLKTPSGSMNSGPEVRVFTGCLSASEMELSEDYTCIISHGPNPRTTHIFDNCIVESCCAGISAAGKEHGFFGNKSSHRLDDFLSFCYTCKKKLGQGKDIYMYRGEKAFCSRECRFQEMLSDEGREKGASDSSASHYDDIFGSVGTCS